MTTQKKSASKKTRKRKILESAPSDKDTVYQLPAQCQKACNTGVEKSDIKNWQQQAKCDFACTECYEQFGIQNLNTPYNSKHGVVPAPAPAWLELVYHIFQGFSKKDMDRQVSLRQNRPFLLADRPEFYCDSCNFRGCGNGRRIHDHSESHKHLAGDSAIPDATTQPWRTLLTREAVKPGTLLIKRDGHTDQEFSSVRRKLQEYLVNPDPVKRYTGRSPALAVTLGHRWTPGVSEVLLMGLSLDRRKTTPRRLCLLSLNERAQQGTCGGILQNKMYVFSGGFSEYRGFERNI